MLPDIFKNALNDDNITFESKRLDVTAPAIIYEDEMMKRFSQMNQFMKWSSVAEISSNKLMIYFIFPRFQNIQQS